MKPDPIRLVRETTSDGREIVYRSITLETTSRDQNIFQKSIMPESWIRLVGCAEHITRDARRDP